MKKFANWLNKTPGRARDLAARLKVKPASVSAVKNGHKPMPWRWMQTVANFSGGALTLEELVRARTRGAK